MGLLSRFGRGLTQAAPIFGQMAQASLLAAADDKKYDRLVKAQEATRKEARDVADISWGRQVGAAETKATAALTSARRAEKIKMLSDGLSLTASLQEVQERSLASYKDQLSDPLLMGAGRIAVQGLFDAAEKRLVDTIRRQNEISAMYQKYVDPEGKIPWADTSAEKNIMTDLAIMSAANIAKDEIMGADLEALNVAGAEGIATEEFDIDTDIFTDVQRAARRENKDVLIAEQLKSLDEALSGRAEPLSDKQKKLFRDTMESYVQDRRHLSDPDISARRIPAEERTDKEIASVLERETGDAKVVEIIEPREGLRAPSPEDIHRIAQSYGALPPNFFAGLGKWLGDIGSWTLEQFQRIPLATIMDWLSRADRAKLESMGIDPDATPVGFGESAMRTGDKPAVEDAIAMMFNMPQRV